jgi:hypothetical protein
MSFAKEILKELEKQNNVEGAEELKEFITECAKAMTSENTDSEELEFFKVAMSCFNEEALKQLQEMTEEKASDESDTKED